MKKLRYTLAALAAFASASVFAATWTVTSTGDDASDPATLRGAIAAASDGDTIEFAASLAGGAVLLDSSLGPISVTRAVVVEGPAAGRIALDMQNAACPILQSFDSDVSVTLRNLEFRNMKNTSGSYRQPQKTDPKTGPAVSILGTATIENCYFHDLWMSQTEDNGGDLYSDGGPALRVMGNLTMTGCEFRNNNLTANTGGVGSAVVVGGPTVSISGCDFVGNGRNAAPKGGTLVVLGSTTDFTADGCLFATNAVQFGQGGILFRQDIASGTFRVRNSVFRAFSGNSGWKNGGAVGCEGGGSARFVFANDEFSGIRFGGWGGAVRIESGSAEAVFANCTFLNVVGYEWGAVTDTRGKTVVVNCTAAGNVNTKNEARCSGTFFAINNVSLLNTVCTWNYSGNGAVWNDTARYGGTLNAYNSVNHLIHGGYNTAVGVQDYDASTVLFQESFATVSRIVDYNLGTAISSPVLTKDADDPDHVPGVVAISPYGILAGKGWPVKHDADWANIAYSQDGGATWTALLGSADAATTLLAADSRGLAYDDKDGVPVPPIGAARDVASEQVDAITILAFAVDTASVSWTEATATLTLHFAPGVDRAAVTAWVKPDGGEAVVWATATATSQNTSVLLTGLSPSTGYTVHFTLAVDGDETVYTTGDYPFTTDSLAAPVVSDVGETTATATASFAIPEGSGWTAARAVFTPVGGGEAVSVEADDLDELVFIGSLLADRDYTVAIEVSREGYAVTSPSAYFQTPFSGTLATSPFRRRIVFTTSGYDGGSTLENFPVLVRLSNETVPGFDPTAIDAAAIRFADMNGNLLAHEVDTWATTADGESTIWVCIPELSGRTTQFALYCKSSASAALTSARDPSRTWLLGGYVGVWHFGKPTVGEDGIPVYADSTGHGLSASPNMASNAPVFPGVAADEWAASVVGTAIQSTQGLYLPTARLSAWADVAAAAISAEAWIHRNNATTGEQKILSSFNSWDHGIQLRVSDRYWYGGGGLTQWSADYPITNAWTHIAAAWAKSGGGYVRVSGEVALSNRTGAEDVGFTMYSLTSNGGGGEAYKGLADEFRLRQGVSSVDWADATYDTSRPGTDFLTYGAYEPINTGFMMLLR